MEDREGVECNCEKCGEQDRVPGERYCKACRRAILARMEDEGYLEPRVKPGFGRGRDAREDIWATKYGVDD